jgi:xanthine dehydrogenase YagS FAD-binding subunit
MKSFEWIDARSVQQAAALLAETTERRPVVAKAGGMDLLELMKEGILAPARVVNLKSIAGLDTVRASADGGLSLGAFATLARIDTDPQVRSRYVALADAASHAATPQVRNTATIGGNLLQRPRCWYYRNAFFHQADTEPLRRRVREGEAENQYHAIFEPDRGPMVHASTPATALIAYGASVELVGREGKTRTVKLAEFLLPPDMSRAHDAAIAQGELLTRVMVPPVAAGTKAAYHKQTERDSYDWPICDVAVVLTLSSRTVHRASIVMGWVAPTPRRAIESEQLLAGRPATEELARAAARAAVADAKPLSKNGYKVPVLEAVVRRTILAAVATPS